jgi:hypothetical protein
LDFVHDRHTIDAIAEVQNGEEDHLLELAERLASHGRPAFGDARPNKT